MNRFSARQVRAVIGACLLQCAMLGILANCSGVLFAQIRLDAGITMVRISAFNTLKGILGAVVAASVTGLFFKLDKRWVLLGNQVLMCLGYLCMTLDPAGPIWYFAAVLVGVSGCLGVIAVPCILDSRFPENPGTVTGFAMAFSGISGAVLNPFSAKLIGLYGLKPTVGILCALDLTAAVLGILLLGREPEQVPRAAGKKKQAQTGGSFAGVTCLLVALVLLGGSIGFQMATNLSIFAQSVGYSLQVGAMLTTMLMLGNVGGKFLYGFLCDRLGVWKATAIGLCGIAIGTVCFLTLYRSIPLLYGGALLFGFIYALSTISISRCCIAAYGEDRYQRYIGIHNSISQAVMAVASMATGVLVDATGSFTWVLLLVLLAQVLSLTAVVLLARRGRKGR